MRHLHCKEYLQNIQNLLEIIRKSSLTGTGNMMVLLCSAAIPSKVWEEAESLMNSAVSVSEVQWDFSFTNLTYLDTKTKEKTEAE